MWANGANWTPNAAPGGIGGIGVLTNTDTALFNNAGNGNTAITIDAGRNIENITFDTSQAAPYIFSGSSLVGTNGGEIQITSSVIRCCHDIQLPFTRPNQFHARKQRQQFRRRFNLFRLHQPDFRYADAHRFQ